MNLYKVYNFTRESNYVLVQGTSRTNALLRVFELVKSDEKIDSVLTSYMGGIADMYTCLSGQKYIVITI